MALIECKNCGKTISDRAVNCPHCGAPVAEPEEDAQQPAPAPAVCAECGAALPENATVCPSCGCPVSEKSPAQEAPKRSKKGLIGGLCVAAVAVIAVAVVAVMFLGKPKKLLEAARATADQGNYAEAIEQINAIGKPELTDELLSDIYGRISSDISALADKGDYAGAQALLDEYSALPDKDQLQQDIYDGVSGDIRTLMDEDDFDGAQALLDEYSALPDRDQLQTGIYEGLSADIEALMDAGDYIAAQKRLDECEGLPDAEMLQNEITFETFGLTCIYDLRPYMKNPNSLQINSIDFYASEGTAYPTVVICESGQNGFGGYATSYSLYTTSDLTLLGSCDSLDEDSYDLDDDDEFAEWLVCIIINGMENEMDVPCNVARMNNLLSTNATPKLDASAYANPVEEEEGTTT